MKAPLLFTLARLGFVAGSATRAGATDRRAQELVSLAGNTMDYQPTRSVVRDRENHPAQFSRRGKNL
jgi:hypothetical protein